MGALKTWLCVMAMALLSGDVVRAQDSLMDFTGRERPGMVMIDPSAVARHRPDLLGPFPLVKIINLIGEGFLDVETALPTPELAAGRPPIAPEMLAEMDAWTNEYGRPWSVASYGGTLTPERKLAHTIRFNTANIFYSPYFGHFWGIFERYMLSDIEIAQLYKDAHCPGHKEYIELLLHPEIKSPLIINHTKRGDKLLCHTILHEWLQRNVSEFASLDALAAIGEMFAWYHSPDYAPGDLPPEVEEMIEGWNDEGARAWAGREYEGKRYEAIQKDLTANLERVNAGWLPDVPEARVADYSTMLFLIATGRL